MIKEEEEEQHIRDPYQSSVSFSKLEFRREETKTKPKTEKLNWQTTKNESKCCPNDLQPTVAI